MSEEAATLPMGDGSTPPAASEAAPAPAPAAPAAAPAAPAAPAPAAPAGPYLGARISLISRSDIRYEGILNDVNPVESTVTLQGVRSFGTEDRPTPTGLQIPASTDVYDYIVFRGADIKDLAVCTTPAPAPVYQDPAIISAGTAKPAASVAPPPVPASPARNHHQHGQQQHHQQAQHQQQHHQQRRGRNRHTVAAGPPGHGGGAGGAGGARQRNSNWRASQGPPRNVKPGTSDYLKSMRVRGATGGEPDIAHEEFDFQAQLDKFDKAGEKAKLQHDDGAEDAKAEMDGLEAAAAALGLDDGEDELDEDGKPKKSSAYDKTSSFFDTISSDASDRQAGRSGRRMNRDEERRLNTQTFGAIGLSDNRRRQRRAAANRRYGGNQGYQQGDGRGGYHQHGGGRGGGGGGGRGFRGWRGGRGGRGGGGRGGGGRGRGGYNNGGGGYHGGYNNNNNNSYQPQYQGTPEWA